MEIHQYNTYIFFRRYFNIPRRIRLKWCIIKESSPCGTELRLGIMLEGSRLYIDVAQRRFFSQIDIGAVQRCCYPARRVSDGEQYRYLHSNGWGIAKPKHYISDIYSTSWFGDDTSRKLFL